MLMLINLHHFKWHTKGKPKLAMWLATLCSPFSLPTLHWMLSTCKVGQQQGRTCSLLVSPESMPRLASLTPLFAVLTSLETAPMIRWSAQTTTWGTSLTPLSATWSKTLREIFITITPFQRLSTTVLEQPSTWIGQLVSANHIPVKTPKIST